MFRQNPRIGKVAMTVAMSTDEEEMGLRETYTKAGYKIGVTYVTGALSEVKKNFVKSIVNCALHGNVIAKSSNQIHSVIHAGIEAMGGIVPMVAGESQLKLKVVVIHDGKWLVVAAYGESAFHSETNHERIGFGVMHL